LFPLVLNNFKNSAKIFISQIFAIWCNVMLKVYSIICFLIHDCLFFTVTKKHNMMLHHTGENSIRWNTTCQNGIPTHFYCTRGEYLNLWRTRWQGIGENYIMKSLMVCTSCRILFGWSIEKNEMDGAYSTYVGEQRCIHGFVTETRRK
jgi:hypothetical protein